MIVVVIFVAVGVITLPFFFGSKSQSDLAAATQQIVASLRESQSHAMTQMNNVPWGVHFANPTNGTPYFAIYSGTNYSPNASQSNYRLPSSIVFDSSTVPAGSSTNVAFNLISGGAGSSTVIRIYVLSQPSISSTITIAASGAVSFTSNAGLLNQGGTGNSTSSPTSTGYLYTADQFNVRVQKIDSNGNWISQLWCSSGTCTQGNGNGKFSNPHDVALDSNGNIYVVDSAGASNNVEKFNSAGTFQYQLGCTSGGCTQTSTNGGFNTPYGAAVDGSNNVYVTDFNNRRVELISSTGTYMRQLGCSSGSCTPSTAAGKFYGPYDVAVDGNGLVYVSDISSYTNRVEVFNSDGTYARQLGCSSGACALSSSSGQFSGPYSIAIDPRNNDVYVTDLNNNRVDKFNSSGVPQFQIGCASGACAATSTNGGFNSPDGVAVDGSGNVYVGDFYNYRIEVFDSNGNYLRQIGCGSGTCSAGSGNTQFSGLINLTWH